MRSCFLAVLFFLSQVTQLTAPILAEVPEKTEVLPNSPYRTQTLQLDCGADLYTIFAESESGESIPMVSFVNDTFGDTDPTNDQLRYVWVYSYCSPSLAQKVNAAIPFLYHRVTPSKNGQPTEAPPVLFDFSKPLHSTWNRIQWLAIQLSVLDPHGWVWQASSRTYVRNRQANQQAHLQLGISILSDFRNSTEIGGSLIGDDDLQRMAINLGAQGLAGAFVSEKRLAERFQADEQRQRVDIGRNWELLRQRCEEEGLFFDPIENQTGQTEHALVWIKRDQAGQKLDRRPFQRRFLNIADPWSDPALKSWSGYSKTFFEDSDGRISAVSAPDSKPVDMIPLALYGLDFPKIPALLVDFRRVLNPKLREVSRQAINDISRFVLDITPFRNLSGFLVQKCAAIIPNKKGVDINQPSRAVTYAQLKSLLMLKDLFDPELKAMIVRDLETANVNPLADERNLEQSFAKAQYQALMTDVERNQLDRQIEQDRRRERVQLKYGTGKTALFKMLQLASLGIFRKKADTPEDIQTYLTARSMRYHLKLLEQVAQTPAPIEVGWAPSRFLPSLEFVARNSNQAPASVVGVLEKIYRNSTDTGVQLASVEGLAAFKRPEAELALARIERDSRLIQLSRARSVRGLRKEPSTPVMAEPTGWLSLMPAQN